jgi:hypothetical protein
MGMLKPSKSKYKKTFGAFKQKVKSEKEIEREKKRAEKSFLERTIHIKEKHIKEHQFYISQIEELGGLPQKNEVWRIRTQAEMNMFTFVLYIIQKYSHIEELTISSYTINQKTTSALFDFFDQGIIKKLNLAISESYSFRMPKMYEQFKKLYNERRDSERLKMCFFWVHGKINLIHCGNDYFVCEGSGNFSNNAQAEFYVLSNNKETYHADMKWMNEFMFENKQNKRHEILQ